MHVHEEIARGPNGYTGSAYTVRRYVWTIRPAHGRVYQEVDYEPGQVMQVDWGTCGRVQVGDRHNPHGLGLCGRALLQSLDVYRIHTLAGKQSSAAESSMLLTSSAVSPVPSSSTT